MNLKKRFANYIILTILCLVFAAVLVSCSRDGVKSLSVSGPEEIKVGDFDYSDFTVAVVYESGGTKKIALDKSMLSNEDNLKFFESGKQTLTVNYDGATCEFSLNVCLYEFADLRFDDVNEVYTGKSITAEVYDNYPEGTNVYYVNGNSFVDAGTYEVTAIVSRKNYVTETLTATVNISKAKYDMSGISFQDKTVEYDGKEHSVAITGILPEGVSVRYEDDADRQTAAGTYEVIARFSSDNDNYSEIDDMKATLTISPKKYDTSKLSFEDTSVVYDKEKHSVKVVGCPDGIGVEYTVEESVNEIDDTYVKIDGTEVCDAGKYRYTATFISGNKNYETIAPITATLTITPAEYDSSDILLESKDVDYDGQGHSIDDPELEKGWSIIARIYEKDGKELYIDGDKDKDYLSEVADSGVYSYTLCAVYESNGNGYCNYDGFELTATLVINKTKYDASKISVDCDTDENGVMRAVVKNIPTDVNGNALTVKIKYFEEKPNDDKSNYMKDDLGENAADCVTEEGQYFVEIEFIGQDSVNYEYLPSKIITFTAKKSASVSDDQRSV